MPSVSYDKFAEAVLRTKIFRTTANNISPKIKFVEKQTYYYAALASYVAAWDAYINNIVKEFFRVTSNPLDGPYSSMHSVANAAAEQALKKFNTPNWENTRNLLIIYMGYDPYVDWVWVRRGMGSAHVQEMLNQILKVRHSFSHGFQIPSYSWTINRNGNIRLTANSVDYAEKFFGNIVICTDKGISAHVKLNYRINLSWY